ncbi:MAG TPA: hypothetical protein DCS82_12140 [Rhodospirillaceae bacterium]|nr:hypothetical protein [Rhodospirillaceae bacterium]HAA93118.1 hypothetical protein [Rhodospirillaceae bacterium]HAT36460.1 hypothetical protein [Rhodospirillaceae bacterium]
MKENDLNVRPGGPFRALLFGFRKRCPCCGRHPLYRSYLKQVEKCGGCGVALGRIRTDDIAPYFTILIVGHLIIPSLLMVEQKYHPPEWFHWILWIPLTLVLMLWFLPRVKGATMALMWHFGLRGDEQR